MDLYQFECPPIREDPPVTITEPATEMREPSTESNQVQPLSYAAVTEQNDRPSYDFDSLPEPEQMGEYPAVTISSKALERGLNFCKFGLLGRMDLKKVGLDRVRKLAEETWKPEGRWLITPLGKGFIFIRFDNPNDYKKVWSAGSTWVFDNEPLRISKWTPNFVPENQKQTRALVWIRLPGLAQEYWDEEILMMIARGIGYPMQIDERTLKRDFGYFAQILVDVDFANPILEQVMVRVPIIGERPAKDFWQTVLIPKYPKLCSHCKVVGHLVHDCTLLNKDPTSNGQARNDSVQASGEARNQRNPLNTLQQDRTQTQQEGETSNAGEMRAQSNNNNGWQTRNRQGRTWVPRNQPRPEGQTNRPRFGVQINGNRFQVLQREESTVGLVSAPFLCPTSTPVDISPTVPAASAAREVIKPVQTQEVQAERARAAAEENSPSEVPFNENVQVTHEVSAPVAEITTNENVQEVPTPSAAGDSIEVRVSSQSADLGPVIIDPGDFGDPEETVPGLQNSQVAIENDEGHDEKSGERKKLLEESLSVSKMLLEQKQSWADLLEEEDDDRESRPSLSQPRRSGRSRSRSRMLEPYVSK
ncbi:hypothetical protein ACHQM5_027231 [Ranunculus cassubicifolius]